MSSAFRGRRTASPAALAVLVALGLCLAGCGGPAPGVAGAPAPEVSAEAPAGPAPSAAIGTPAASTRVTFVPTRVVLPGDESAAVEPAVTRDGELRVPEDVRHVGWWDGSAYAGDAFGNTVLAGHVDSATDGLGFFARLLAVRKGDRITLQGSEGRHLAYTVTSVRTLKKDALATSSSAFDQTGDPHLVLITCGGAYRPDEGGYDSNVVVTARPDGLARRD